MTHTVDWILLNLIRIPRFSLWDFAAGGWSNSPSQLMERVSNSWKGSQVSASWLNFKNSAAKKEDFAANADFLFFLDPQSSTEEDADEQVKDLVDLSLKKMVCSGLYACLIHVFKFPHHRKWFNHIGLGLCTVICNFPEKIFLRYMPGLTKQIADLYCKQKESDTDQC